MNRAEVVDWAAKFADSEDRFSLAELLGIFADIAAIYRPSNGESRIRNWLQGLAEKAGLDYQQDERGNLVIRMAAHGSKSNEPLIFQAHIDMVCVASSPDYDWPNRAVELRTYGDEWLAGNGTTLGADNGIGVAIMVWLLVNGSSFCHPPLELLFTVAEEVGLQGAVELDPTLVSGRNIINLDCSDGNLFIDGCSGGCSYVLDKGLPPTTPSAVDWGWRLQLQGLPGGHSGLQINQHQGNSILLLLRCWQQIQQRLANKLHLIAVTAGSASNVIPSNFTLDFGWQRPAATAAIVATSKEELEQQLLTGLQQCLLAEQELYPQLEWTIEQLNNDEIHYAIAPSIEQIITDLHLLPNGVQLYNHGKQVVELSANLAMLELNQQGLKVVNSIRFSRPAQQEWLEAQIKRVAEIGKLNYHRENIYPSWTAAHSSQLRSVALQCSHVLFDTAIRVCTIHGGLECGVLVEKLSEHQQRSIDAISIGPTTTGLHTTAERLNIPSLKKTVTLLLRIIDKLNLLPSVSESCSAVQQE